jgi:hypothetical protein
MIIIHIVADYIGTPSYALLATSSVVVVAYPLFMNAAKAALAHCGFVAAFLAAF